jgi:Na+/alanine symporter
MEAINLLVGKIGGFAWGPIMIFFLVGTGVLLTLGTPFVNRYRWFHWKIRHQNRPTPKNE